jgi:hypothetical protein
MATNYSSETATRPDLSLWGSLHLRSLLGPAPGEPGFLALNAWAIARVPFSSSDFARMMPDWIKPDRKRADAIRGIGQTDVSPLDPAKFQTGSVHPRERGLPAPVDYRQPQIAHGLGPMEAQNAAARLSLADLLQTMEVVMYNAGVNETTPASGLNVATLLGASAATDAEAEVTDPTTSLPFDLSGAPWTDPDSDALGQLQSMIAAYVDRHGVPPNEITLTAKALYNLRQSNSILSLIEGPVTITSVLDKLRGQGLSKINIAYANIGLAEGTVLMQRSEIAAGADPATGYHPLALVATDQIDSKGEDYQMGVFSGEIGTPALAALIGYRAMKAKWGSIEEVRAACNFDVDRNYRGIARAVGALG